LQHLINSKSPQQAAAISAKTMNIANNADPLSAIRALQLMRGSRPTGS